VNSRKADAFALGLSMTELKYKFTYDTLFKLLFVRHPDSLKRLVAAAL
jgi:hypothetical protein